MAEHENDIPSRKSQNHGYIFRRDRRVSFFYHAAFQSLSFGYLLFDALHRICAVRENKKKFFFGVPGSSGAAGASGAGGASGALGGSGAHGGSGASTLPVKVVRHLKESIPFLPLQTGMSTKKWLF